MTSQCRTPLTFSAHQKPTVGDSKFSAVTSDHMGWMLCNGRTVAVTDFQFLFNIIGYSFGGSGTQFMLPNPQGKTPGAIGQGTDINNSTFTTVLGQRAGEPSSDAGALDGLNRHFYFLRSYQHIRYADKFKKCIFAFFWFFGLFV